MGRLVLPVGKFRQRIHMENTRFGVFKRATLLPATFSPNNVRKCVKLSWPGDSLTMLFSWLSGGSAPILRLVDRNKNASDCYGRQHEVKQLIWRFWRSGGAEDKKRGFTELTAESGL